MDDLLRLIITNAPNLLGLVALAYVLWRQNERLLIDRLTELKALQLEVQELRASVHELSDAVSQLSQMR